MKISIDLPVCFEASFEDCNSYQMDYIVDFLRGYNPRVKTEFVGFTKKYVLYMVYTAKNSEYRKLRKQAQKEVDEWAKIVEEEESGLHCRQCGTQAG